MKYLARRLARRARDNLAQNDGWFALAVLGVIIVPVVTILCY